MSLIGTGLLCERDSDTIAVGWPGLEVYGDERCDLVPNAAGEAMLRVAGITPAASESSIAALERCDLLGL
jgi:hypothetical protein